MALILEFAAGCLVLFFVVRFFRARGSRKTKTANAAVRERNRKVALANEIRASIKGRR